jgi:hypothetical protein
MALRVGLTAAALAWLAGRVDPQAALAALDEVPRWLFAVPLLLLLANSGLHAWRLQLLLRAAGAPLPWHRILLTLLRASFVGAVTPRGGADVARIGWLSQETGQPEAVLAAAATARILELLPWAVLLAYGLLWGLPALLPTLATSAAVFLVLFTGVLGAAVLLVRFGPQLAERLPMFADRAVVVAKQLQQLRHAPRALALATAIGGWIALHNVLSVWLLFRGAGVPVPPAAAPAIVPAMDTVISLPVTVSGLGLREGVFVVALAPWGISEATAVALGLVRWSGELGRALLGGLLVLLIGTPGSPGSPADETR